MEGVRMDKGKRFKLSLYDTPKSKSCDWRSLSPSRLNGQATMFMMGLSLREEKKKGSER